MELQFLVLLQAGDDFVDAFARGGRREQAVGLVHVGEGARAKQAGEQRQHLRILSLYRVFGNGRFGRNGSILRSHFLSY